MTSNDTDATTWVHAASWAQGLLFACLFACWLVGLLVCWLAWLLVGLVAGWLAGLLARPLLLLLCMRGRALSLCSLAGTRAHRRAGAQECMLIGLVAGWLAGGLTGWLVGLRVLSFAPS